MLNNEWRIGIGWGYGLGITWLQSSKTLLMTLLVVAIIVETNTGE